MGSYTFRWEHPAADVYVTGTFDDWAKSVKLDAKDGAFEKTVQLPQNDEKVLYKFVVDGNWTTSTEAPQEDDGHGIYNNVLVPSDFHSLPSTHTMSSAAPDSTTAQLAGEQPPQETPRAEDVPGAFIETPANELQQFSVNPIPASNGDANPVKLAPGDKVPEPSTIHSNTLESHVKDDEELKAQHEQQEHAFGVNPLPASETAGNPISLAPGEKVPEPESISANNIHSHVTLDKESYEKGDSLPPQLGPVVTPGADRANMFDIPGLTSSTIPESSLPIGSGPSAQDADPGVTVQSAHPVSTTAALAGEVPKEPRGVPEVVSESQHEAGAAPEASANPIAVDEKADVEEELLEKVPEQPATSENSVAAEVAGVVAGGLATAGVAAASAAATAANIADNKAAEAVDSYVPTTSPTSDLKELAHNSTTESGPADGVPEVVSDSIKEAHASPEATENAEAVADKSAFEQELLNKVPETNAAGQSAEDKDVPATVYSSIEQAHTSPEAVANPEAVADKSAFEQELLHSIPKSEAHGEPAPAAVSSAVPEIAQSSISQADQSPEAAANTQAVHQKSAVEDELKQEVRPTDEIADVAPTESAALSATAPAATSGPDISPKALSPEEPLKSSSEPSIPATTLSVPPGSDSKPEDGLNAPADAPAQADPSRDVSPKTDPAGPPTTTEQTEPTVVTGTETTTAPATSGEGELKPPATPAKSEKGDKSAPDTPASQGSDKKAKRRSFWGKIKEKFTGGAHKE